MSQQFKTKEFLALQKTWYNKLAAKGFQDIENSNDSLRLYHSEYFADPRRHSPISVEARENYFRIAGQFYNDHKFENAWDKEVWGMHAEGLSIREIAAKLKRKGYKDKINLALMRLEIEMINKAKGKV